MVAGRHNQICTTSRYKARARSTHCLSYFGSPPFLFFVGKKIRFQTPKRFRRIGFCRNGRVNGVLHASTRWYGHCTVLHMLAVNTGRPCTQACKSRQRRAQQALPVKTATASALASAHWIHSQLLWGRLRHCHLFFGLPGSSRCTC